MLTSATVHFRWQPPAQGHHWVAARPVADNWSIAKHEVQVLASCGTPMGWKFYGAPGTEYEPLKRDTGLFRELAALEPTEDAILAFANHYGPLTKGRLFVPPGNKEAFPKPPLTRSLAHSYLRPSSTEGAEAENYAGKWVLRGAVIGDSLETWQETIRALRVLVGLWEALGRQDKKGIEKVTQFQWQDDKRTIRLVDHDGRPLEEPIRFDKASSPTLKLQVAAGHALFQSLTGRFADGAAISLYPPESRERGKLAIVPRSLCDALWLQFALAVIEDKTFRACEVCGKSFEVSPHVARTNRTLCSGACKAKAHRQRRDQALKLAGQGVTPKKIAEQVGSQLATVRKWLAEPQEK